MEKWISLDCHITFQIHENETPMDAEDRLLGALDNAGIHIVSWTNEEVEGIEGGLSTNDDQKGIRRVRHAGHQGRD